MKRLLLTVATLAAFTILVPQDSVAVWENQVGIYTDQVGSPAAANYTATPNVPFDVYLVITDPVNFTYNGGTNTYFAVSQIGGFEAKVIWPSDATFFKLSETFPVDAIDAAAEPDEYAVGFATPVNVSGGAAVVCTWQLMVTTTDPYQIFMDHIRFDSLDGKMAYVDAGDPNTTDWQDGNLSPMYGSTNGSANPVFSINDASAVSIESETWGGVKSLFK